MLLPPVRAVKLGSCSCQQWVGDGICRVTAALQRCSEPVCCLLWYIALRCAGCNAKWCKQGKPAPLSPRLVVLEVHFNAVVGLLWEISWSLGCANRGTDIVNLPLQLNTHVGQVQWEPWECQGPTVPMFTILNCSLEGLVLSVYLKLLPLLTASTCLESCFLYRELYLISTSFCGWSLRNYVARTSLGIWPVVFWLTFQSAAFL